MGFCGHSSCSDLRFVEHAFIGTLFEREADKGFHDFQSSNDENWAPGEGFQETTYLIDSLFK